MKRKITNEEKRIFSTIFAIIILKLNLFFQFLKFFELKFYKNLSNIIAFVSIFSFLLWKYERNQPCSISLATCQIDANFAKSKHLKIRRSGLQPSYNKRNWPTKYEKQICKSTSFFYLYIKIGYRLKYILICRLRKNASETVQEIVARWKMQHTYIEQHMWMVKQVDHLQEYMLCIWLHRFLRKSWKE